jgi:hypothetical protein
MPRHCSRLLAALLVTAVSIVPSALEAQACLGNPSFSTNHLQVGAGARFDPSTTSFGGDFISGSETLFAGLSLGGASYDGVSGSSLLAGIRAGFQVPVTSGTMQVCPVVGAEFGFGPSDFDGAGTDFRSQAFSFGLAAGGELFRSDRLAIVPSVSMGFAYTGTTATGVLATVTETDTYGVAGAAIGFVLSDRLSVRPSVSFPIGLEGADPIFGIGFALNYGGRR